MGYFKRRDFKYFTFDSFKFFILSVMILFASTNIFNIYKNEVNINFIDVGQGDACLIRGKQNNILIDTGGIAFGKGDNGKSVLIPYLQKNGVKKLDFVFISHLDADHCKNLGSLSKEVEIKNLFFRKDGYRDFVKKYGEVKAENIYNIENNLKINLGVQVDAEMVTSKERVNRTKENNFNIALMNWTGDFLDPITYLDLFESTNANNRGKFVNSRYDQLVKTVKSTDNPQTRVPAMIEMEKIISQEAPVVILFQKQKQYLVNPRVTNLGFVSIGGEFFIRDVVMN